MATMLSQKLVEAQEANDTVKWFLRKFEVGKLLSICRAHKAKGVIIMNEGTIRQFDTPEAINRHPADAFVASLVNSAKAKEAFWREYL